MYNSWQLNSQLISPLDSAPLAPADLLIKVFDRDEVFIADLDPELAGVVEIESLEGEYTLELTYPSTADDADELEEGRFIAIPDMDRNWQLFEIIRIKKKVNSSGELIVCYCEHVFYSLATELAISKSFSSATAAEAMDEILSGTRWKRGYTISGTSTFSFIDRNPLAALRLVESRYDGELRFRVTLTGSNSLDFYVDLLAQRGRITGQRFEFGENLDNIEIEINTENLVTALQGRGQGEEIDPDSGEAERIDFSNVEWSTASGDPADKPLGQDWVGDDSAKALYGKPDGQGGREHIYGLYESQASTPEALLQETWEQLQSRNEPLVNIKADIRDLEKANISNIFTHSYFLFEAQILQEHTVYDFSHEQIRLGDTGYVLVPRLQTEVEARIIRLVRDRKNLLNTNIEIGNFISLSSDTEKDLIDNIKTAQARQGIHDRAGFFEPDDSGNYKVDLAAKSVQIKTGDSNLVKADGVLSVFQFVSIGERGGWGHFGLIDDGESIWKGRVQVTVSIPENFTVTRATIKLEAMPVYFEDATDPSRDGWKQSRNLKLYKSPGNDGFLPWVYASEWYPPYWRNETDVTNTAFGVSSWSPELIYDGTDEANPDNLIQYLESGDIKDLLESDLETTFYVETTDDPTQANADVNKGLGRIIVVVEGYAS